MRNLQKSHQQQTRKVARMIQLYWERKLGAVNRERREEEKRLRALAKSTAREVAKQWRLAINVVRARKVARAKEEEDLKGRKQLTAILEQSTQMLNQQHQDLLGEQSEGDSEDEGEEVVSDDEHSASLALESDDEDQATEADREPDVGEPPKIQRAETTELTQMIETISPQSPSYELGDSSGTEEEPAALDDIAFLGRPTTHKSRGTDDSAVAEEPDEEDFDLEVQDADAAEDQELEQKMLELEEEDEDEDADLLAEADMPIEELLKKYGGASQAAGAVREPSEDGSQQDAEDQAWEKQMLRRRRRSRRRRG